MPTNSDDRSMTLTRTRRLVAVAAGVALGITGAFAAGSAQPERTATACPATEADLLRAADAARILEAQRPDLFAQSPRPADHDDLRLAAEWARRLSVLDPSRATCDGG